MITYAHEKYIEEAIKSVFMQQTDFFVELIIANDSSPDNTDGIVKKLILNAPLNIEVKYKKHTVNRGMMSNFIWGLNQARGKYIALCEGDDYWTDSLKLQKQVNFMEANPDYGLAHADCNLFYQNSGKFVNNANKIFPNNLLIHNKKDLFHMIIEWNYLIRTATVMFRKDLLNKIPKNTVKFLMGDTPTWLDFSQITKFIYFDEVFSVYRILPNSASKSRNSSKQYRFNLSMYEMRIYYLKKYDYQSYRSIEMSYNNALLNYLVFNPDYKPMYPLFVPSLRQRVKNIFLKHSFFRYLLKINLRCIDFYKLIRGHIDPLDF